MLVQRILTAIVLLVVVVVALRVASPWPFVVLLTLASACCAWEWLSLRRGAARRRPGWPVWVAAVLFLFMFWLAKGWIDAPAAPTPGMMHGLLAEALAPAVVLVWLIAATIAVARADVSPGSSWGWQVFCVPAVLAAWFAASYAYLSEGAAFVISLFITVWVADVAAYFAGRAFGRRKLAPKVSPGKSVEGALAGVLGAALWTLASGHWWFASYGALLARQWGLFGSLILGAVLGAVSIVGDLFESLLKRRAGIKDSSGLLPGHGGVFDRLDALLPVLPLAMLLAGVSLK